MDLVESRGVSSGGVMGGMAPPENLVEIYLVLIFTQILANCYKYLD